MQSYWRTAAGRKGAVRTENIFPCFLPGNVRWGRGCLSEKMFSIWCRGIRPVCLALFAAFLVQLSRPTPFPYEIKGYRVSSASSIIRLQLSSPLQLYASVLLSPNLMTAFKDQFCLVSTGSDFQTPVLCRKQRGEGGAGMKHVFSENSCRRTRGMFFGYWYCR